MALAVDALQLGQIGTNCYLVRADRSAPRRSSSIPAPTRAEIRLALARSGATCAAILLTHSHFDHFGALADLAEGTGAPVWLPEGELDVFRRPQRLLPGHPDPRLRRARRRCSPAARRSRRRASRSRCSPSPATRPATSPTTPTAASSRATSSSPARSAAPTCPFGDWDTLLESIRTLVEALSARDGRLLRSRAADDARRRARPQPVPRRAARHVRRSDRAAARHARHPPVRAAALAARDGRDGAALRALRLPADPDAGLRGHGPLRAHVGPGLGRRAEGDVHVHRPLATGR